MFYDFLCIKYLIDMFFFLFEKFVCYYNQYFFLKLLRAVDFFSISIANFSNMFRTKFYYIKLVCSNLLDSLLNIRPSKYSK